MNFEHMKFQLKYPNVTSTEETSAEKPYLNVYNVKCAGDSGAFFSINKDIDYKTLCEKDDKFSYYVKANNSNYFECFDIKLPPIVVPILKNLTNQKSHENKFSGCELNIKKIDYKDPSVNNLETSKTKQNLKSGHLRKSLMNYPTENSLVTVDDNGIAYRKENEYICNNLVLIKNETKPMIRMNTMQEVIQNNDNRIKLRSNSEASSVVNYPLQRISPAEREQGKVYLL